MKKNIISSKKYAIEIENYTKKFKKFTAVNNISFGVGHGKIHGFIGPNGAGKTTTIKAIIGAFYKNKGKIYVEGFPAGSIKAKSKIGYIPERSSFPDRYNSIDYLTLMGQLSGIKKKEARQKAIDYLKKVDLWKERFKKPNTFSSGMKKKILVGQALMATPSVLILDEPAANLDPTARKDMFNIFKSLAKKGCSILLSSHILSELQDVVDEVTFINNGEIKYSGDITNLSAESGLLFSFADRNNEDVKNFIKKYKMSETTSGWKILTNTHDESIKIAKEALDSKIDISNISFLKSNLSAAYDMLVMNDKSKEKNQTNKQEKKGGKKKWLFSKNI